MSGGRHAELREALERVHKFCSLLAAPTLVDRTETAWILPDSLKEVFEDDPGLARDLITMFRTDMEDRLRNCNRFIAEEDRAELKRLFHSIKGSSRQMGAGQMAELAAEMERVAGTAELASLGDQLLALEEAFRVLQNSISATLDHAPVQKV
jgi:HPt (histidine-containing phosphotransfer) domain-containing protein